MRKEKVIYSLLKTVLYHDNSEKTPELSEQQWEEVYKELREQTISGLPAEWVFEHMFLPEMLRQKWEKEYMWQVAFFYQLLYEQNELVKLMSKHQISMAILKGTAAAIYYPQPTMRLMGDIDFLVPEEEYQRAYLIMLKNGYELFQDEDHVDYHMTLKKGKMIYEIHRKPAGMPEGDEGKYLQHLLNEGLHTLDILSVDAYEVPVLPSLQNGIVLLLHIVKHLKSGLGLRQIIDWMMYVNRELHDDSWYSNMQPVLQKTSYEKLAKAVTKMCQVYLGLTQEDITWCKDVEDDVCEKLLSYIMNQGNFGCKVKEDEGIAKTLGEIRNPIQFFTVLQTRGEEHWSILERHPILRPFAWMYTCCRYLRKTIQKKSPVKKLAHDIKSGNERRDLFEKIGL